MLTLAGIVFIPCAIVLFGCAILSMPSSSRKSQTTRFTCQMLQERTGTFHLKKKFKPKEKPSICDDLLTPDEWTTVTQYLEILRPFHEATLKLEGKATKGKFFFP